MRDRRQHHAPAPLHEPTRLCLDNRALVTQEPWFTDRACGGTATSEAKIQRAVSVSKPHVAKTGGRPRPQAEADPVARIRWSW